MITAVCSGSFDPITLGHMDIIRRAAACFDQVLVCVSANTEKRSPMFTTEQKLALVREAIRPIPNARAELLHGLIADFAVEHGAHIIVRGVRNVSDHDSETQMAIINRSIRPELETMFLPASPEYQHFSSSMVRDMILYGRPLELYLPKEILPMVRQLIQDKER